MDKQLRSCACVDVVHPDVLLRNFKLRDVARLETACQLNLPRSFVAVANTIDFSLLTREERYRVPDAFARSLGRSMHSWMYIDLAFCENLTDDAIRAVAANCPALESLRTRSCKNLTNEAITAMTRPEAHRHRLTCHSVALKQNEECFGQPEG